MLFVNIETSATIYTVCQCLVYLVQPTGLIQERNDIFLRWNRCNYFFISLTSTIGHFKIGL